MTLEKRFELLETIEKSIQLMDIVKAAAFINEFVSSEFQLIEKNSSVEFNGNFYSGNLYYVIKEENKNIFECLTMSIHFSCVSGEFGNIKIY